SPDQGETQRDPSDDNTIEETEKETKVDYRKLNECLAKEQWKEADEETMRVMLEIADREESGFLQRTNIEKFPDTAIQAIDQLWRKYSKGHFGFNVQAKIWRECKVKPGKFEFKTYQNKFGVRTGWYINENWLNNYDDFQFSLEAPQGHLPSLSFPNFNDKKIDWTTLKEVFQYFLPRFLSIKKI
ncbi:MAG: GUN4 domain-containing protein, partial [Moorea sp. SIO3I7]|nr:GUN4 domain-containing protein [Moorena sp. SIO3I7]